MKRVLSVLLVVAALFTLCSCGNKPTNGETPSNEEKSPKVFSSDGMSITLTEEFQKNTQQGYTVCYDSQNVAVFVLKEAFSLQQGMEDLTLNEYAELVRKSNSSKSPTQISNENGLTSMEYSFSNESDNQTYKYFCTMFKSTDAFWLVQFASLEGSYDTYKDSFVGWAKTVEFAS